MEAKRPLGISFIGYFYIFGAIVLLITLFTHPTEEFGIAVRFGLPGAPEEFMRALIAVLSVILAYGYLKQRKWGYVMMLVFIVYFLLASLAMSNQYKNQLFYGNAIWSIVVLTYTLKNRTCFAHSNGNGSKE